MATRKEHAARPGRESLSKRLGRVARQIKARDGHACVYCGATERTSGAHLHLDHLIPRIAGGRDVASNLVIACRSCNCARQDMPLSTWARKLGRSTSWSIRAQATRPLPNV